MQPSVTSIITNKLCSLGYINPTLFSKCHHHWSVICFFRHSWEHFTLIIREQNTSERDTLKTKTTEGAGMKSEFLSKSFCWSHPPETRTWVWRSLTADYSRQSQPCQSVSQCQVLTICCLNTQRISLKKQSSLQFVEDKKKKILYNISQSPHDSLHNRPGCTVLRVTQDVVSHKGKTKRSQFMSPVLLHRTGQKLPPSNIKTNSN